MKRKWLAAALLASWLLSGCDVSGSGNSNPSTSSSSQSVSASNNSGNVSTTDNSVNEPQQSTSDSTPESTFSTENSSTTEQSTSTSEYIQSTSEVESSSLQSTASSSTTESVPDKPFVVVIPDVPMPSSPGINIAKAASGSVDYSNAKYGYISACYTGDKGKCKLRIEANGQTYDHDLDPNGKTEYYPLSMGSGKYKVSLFERIEGTSYSVVLRQEFQADIDNSLSPFLYPNRYVLFDKGADCTYKAAELCAGKDKTIDKIASVFVWVTDNITYDFDLAATVKSGYVPNPDAVLTKKSGICFDYASLMAAMLRSQGIPSRLVIGYASPDIYHAWNEVYTKETGWITPELLLKNSGYNLVDATFYAGSSDKKKISEYISNNGNYSAVYYY
ncbi:MAG: transglutaminase family protein [Oscillospiraceae bacterium]